MVGAHIENTLDNTLGHADVDAKLRQILIVIGQLDRGGTEQHLASILPQLHKADRRFTVFSFKPGGALEPGLEAAGIPVVSPRRSPRGFWGLVFIAVGLCAYLRREKPDVVHYFLPEAYIVGAMCGSIMGIQHQVLSRRSLRVYQKRYPGIDRIERFLHRRMRRLVGNSNAILNELRSEGVPEEKLRLIYNGVEISTPQRSTRSHIRGDLGISSGALVFVKVANLISYKGHGDLLEALAGIRDELPRDWVLLCCGRDDGIGEALRSLAARLGLAAHVHWLGSVDNVPEHLMASDIGVLASHQEGFSNAVLEYMSAGLPVVVTSVGGNPEAVDFGRCGRLVPAHQPHALRKALLEVVNDPKQRVGLGALGREFVSRNFSVAACVQKYAVLYDELLAEAGS